MRINVLVYVLQVFTVLQEQQPVPLVPPEIFVRNLMSRQSRAQLDGSRSPGPKIVPNVLPDFIVLPQMLLLFPVVLETIV